jgi:hypothetical protein
VFKELTSLKFAALLLQATWRSELDAQNALDGLMLVSACLPHLSAKICTPRLANIAFGFCLRSRFSRDRVFESKASTQIAR